MAGTRNGEDAESGGEGGRGELDAMDAKGIPELECVSVRVSVGAEIRTGAGWEAGRLGFPWRMREHLSHRGGGGVELCGDAPILCSNGKCAPAREWAARMETSVHWMDLTRCLIILRLAGGGPWIRLERLQSWCFCGGG
jgi:hypothetical protein